MPDSHPVHNDLQEMQRNRTLGIVILIAIIILIIAILVIPAILTNAAAPEYPYPGHIPPPQAWLPLILR
jgi:flagellar basal body-associated protein FliL